MPRIDKLTDEQIARFPEFVERWTKIGLSTQPADRPATEKAIAMIYRAGGLEPPKEIVWCGSPLSQGFAHAIMQNNKLGASVGESVWASVRASVWASVGESVRASVGESVRASVWASVGESVRASVWESVWDSVGESVRESVRASVWESVRASVGESIYGQHEAGWLSFYSFFKEVAGLDAETDKLDGLLQLSQSAGWVIPCANICWVSERQNIMARDDQGLLHSVVGPALAYPDGWEIYAVHGVRVRENWITQTNYLTAADVFKERTAEVRRAGCELIGWDRVLSGIDARLIDEDGDEFVGTLYEGQIPGAERCGFLKVRCGTGRQFVIPVESGLGSAMAAQAWIQNVRPSEWLKPEVRG
jgi:hypothetical protein